MTEYEIAKAERDKLEFARNRASLEFQRFPRMVNGMTPDSVKQTPEWRQAREEYTLAATMLRKFNVWFIGKFSKEILEERRNKR